MREPYRSALLHVIDGTTGTAMAERLCAALAAPSVVLCRVWIAGSDGHLWMQGSAGWPTGGGSYSRTDGEFSRVKPGLGKVGQVASTRTPLIVGSVRGDEHWIANPAWIARQGVRSLIALPMVTNDRCLGVLALFSRSSMGRDDLEDLSLLVDACAVRLNALAERMVEDRPAVVTRSQLRDLEKRAIAAALVQSRGRVFGAQGAAALLEMKPTTLASRIKALGIRTPGTG